VTSFDAMNQAAELRAVNVVLRALGDLADRLDACVSREVVVTPTGAAVGAVADEVRAVCRQLAAEVSGHGPLGQQRGETP
jgi:hypothetical protein